MNNSIESIKDFQEEKGYLPQYTTSGIVENKYTTKHGGIKKLFDYGLPIPPTIVLGESFNEDVLNLWVEKNINNDFIIRTSTYSEINTGTESNREPSINDLHPDKLRNFVNSDQCVLIQALPKDSINSNSLSGLIEIGDDLDKRLNVWNVYCHPDIATLTNRILLTSWWIVEKYGKSFSKVKQNNPESRKLFLDFIKYRVGSSLLKKEGIKLPKLEKIEPKCKDWFRGVEYCEKNINNLPEYHSLVKLLKEIDTHGINNIMPHEEDLENIKRLLGSLRSLHLNLVKQGFHKTTKVKFSITGDQLFCWSIIGANEIKTRHRHRPDTIEYSYHDQYYKGR